jgi:peptidyl-tRNA hydrolase, PTH1 family
MILIIGLGNPGKEYELTRHNIGFVIIDKIIGNLEGSGIQYHKYESLIIENYYRDKKVTLLKPMTFMNNSGSAVSKFYRNSSDEIESILVMHDDLDVEFGQVKLKAGGGSGGHNGLDSIIRKLDNCDFDRLRFGVGRPTGRKNAADFVLTKFKKTEMAELPFLVDKSVEAVKDYISRGIDYTMNKYNFSPD